MVVGGGSGFRHTIPHHSRRVMCHMHGGKGMGRHGPTLVGFHRVTLLTTAHSIMNIIEKPNVFISKSNKNALLITITKSKGGPIFNPFNADALS
jgi:hypothetical protein